SFRSSSPPCGPFGPRASLSGYAQSVELHALPFSAEPRFAASSIRASSADAAGLSTNSDPHPLHRNRLPASLGPEETRTISPTQPSCFSMKARNALAVSSITRRLSRLSQQSPDDPPQPAPLDPFDRLRRTPFSESPGRADESDGCACRSAEHGKPGLDCCHR